MDLEEKLRQVLKYSKNYKEINTQLLTEIQELEEVINKMKNTIKKEAVKWLELNEITKAKELINQVGECDALSKTLKSLTNEVDQLQITSSKKYDLNHTFQGSTVIAFELFNEKFEVRSWKDLLIKSCNYFLEHYQEEFINIVEKDKIRGSTRKYLSYDSVGMRHPIQLNKEGVYIETHHSTRDIIRIIKEILQILRVNNYEYYIYLNEK